MRVRHVLGCAQLEPNRTALALHCLGLNGYEIYHPQLREQRRRHGRKITVTPPLFPGYAFVLIVSGWWDARWSAGVVRLIMDGLVPARVPDAVIDEIRSRERGGFVELLKPRGFAPGMRVRVISGPLCDQIGLLAALRPHERVLVWLQLLGGQQRVGLGRNAIEAV
jgi:transcriptional antiterminator RfaH